MPLETPYELVTLEHAKNPSVLTTPAEAVTFPLSAEVQAFIEALKQKLVHIEGVGLAAPQVGVGMRIVAVRISEDAKNLRNDGNETFPLTVLINPQYIPAQDAAVVYDWEGCFSVAETTGKVPRYSKIIYTAQDETGKITTKEATGFTARVLQHEIDHIQGQLIINRLTPDCVQGHPKDMRAKRLAELSPQQKAIAEKILARQADATEKKKSGE